MTTPDAGGPDRDAATAAAGAGVTIRELHSPAEMQEASDLLARIWRMAPGTSHLDSGLLVALAHAGNYVAAAEREGVMVAVCVGFFHAPERRTLHSHITGVAAEVGGRGVGAAIKFHQRAWALRNGADTVTWTFDPLVARNAYFNIHRLGASVAHYLPDFYGTMTDGINRGQPSDRILVAWNLRAPAGAEPDTSEPDTSEPDASVPDAVALTAVGNEPRVQLDRLGSARSCRVEIPADIEALRIEDPEAAIRWRFALRETLGGLLAEGWQVVDVPRSGGYRLRRDG